MRFQIDCAKLLLLLAVAGGAGTSVTACTGLTGGAITASGTIALANVGTAGTYGKVTTDAQGRVVSGAALGASDVTGALAYSPVNKAGDTLTGDLALAAHNLTNVGYITMAQGKYLGLGSFDSAGEATLISGTLTAGGVTYAGAAWYNSTLKVIKYWDGTQAATLNTAASVNSLQSLNGLTGVSQSLAVASAGTAPAWASSSTTHTLNLPLASSASVTAGLLSNTDYVSFGAKQNALGFTPLDRAGGNAMAANLNMSPDGGTTQYKILNLKDPTGAQEAATKNYVDTSLTTAAAAAGTVKSVALSAPSIFTVSGSPITSTGTLSFSLASQSANTVLAGPTSGSAAPSFRNLNIGDIRSSVSGSFLGGSACTSGQVLTYSSLTDTVSCSALTISSTQISGLGGAALLNVGTVVGTVAAGNDSRLTGALQSSSTVTGDLSGTLGAPVVAKIQGIVISATPPANGQALTYNATTTSWEPMTISTSGPVGVTALTGDVTASGSGSAAATVASVGGSSATNVHAAELLANAATNASTANAIVRRDGAGGFNAVGLSASTVAFRDASSNTATIQAPSSIASSYALHLPSSLGTNGQILSTDASGQLAWTTAANALPPNGSAGGDLGASYPSPTVAKIRGVSVSSTAPTSAQFLVYDGSTQYAPISMSGDMTMSAAGAMSLKSVGTAGTYGKVTTDAQGRVTSGAALSSSDVVTALGFTPKTGTVTSITAGTGLTGSVITTSGTIAVDTGTTAGKIVALDSNAKLPAVDGSQLTNVAMPPFSNMVVLSTTGSSNWTVPAGVSKVYVQLWGGGAAGGGGTNSGIAGGGGGAGGYGAGFVAVTAGATVAVTVGTGGCGGGSAAAGTAGGSTSFGALSANGGSAGSAASVAPAAGGTSGATMNMTGGSGSAASPYSTTSLGGVGGSASGGGGAGGGGSANASNTGGAGAAPGGGGGGSGSSTLTAGATGGAGGAGRIVIWY